MQLLETLPDAGLFLIQYLAFRFKAEFIFAPL